MTTKQQQTNKQKTNMYDNDQIKTLVTYIRELDAEFDRSKRQTICRKMFRIIAEEETLKYLSKHKHGNILLNTVNKKLIELYHARNVREASVWYRNIFGERIPIIEETIWVSWSHEAMSEILK